MESGIGTLSTNCNSALHRAVREANRNELVKKTNSIVKSSEQAIKALDKECAALKRHQRELEQQMHLRRDSSHMTVSHLHSSDNQTYKTGSKSFNAGIDHGRGRRQSGSSLSTLVRQGSNAASPSGPVAPIAGAHRSPDIAKYKQRRDSHDGTFSKYRENKDRTGRDEQTQSTSEKRVSFAKLNEGTRRHGSHQGEVATRTDSYIKHGMSSSAGISRRMSTTTSAVSEASTPPYPHAGNPYMQHKNSNVASTSGQSMAEMQNGQRLGHVSADMQGSAFNLAHRKLLHDQQARLSKDSLFYHLSNSSPSNNAQQSAISLLKRGSISGMSDLSISGNGPGYLHGTAARHEQSPQTHEDAQETQRILNYAITCIKKADTERLSATEMEEKAEKEAIAKASQNAGHSSGHGRNISNPSALNLGNMKPPPDVNPDNNPAFLQQLEKFIKEGASHDVKISSKLMSQIEPLLPKQQKLNNDNSKSVKYYIEVINTLQNMRKLGSTTFDPEEVLNCRYLRLSKANIEELEEMCRLRGIDPGIHPHSGITGYSTDLFDDDHDRDDIIAVGEARQSDPYLGEKSRK